MRPLLPRPTCAPTQMTSPSPAHLRANPDDLSFPCPPTCAPTQMTSPSPSPAHLRANPDDAIVEGPGRRQHDAGLGDERHPYARVLRDLWARYQRRRDAQVKPLDRRRDGRDRAVKVGSRNLAMGGAARGRGRRCSRLRWPRSSPLAHDLPGERKPVVIPRVESRQELRECRGVPAHGEEAWGVAALHAPRVHPHARRAAVLEENDLVVREVCDGSN